MKKGKIIIHIKLKKFGLLVTAAILIGIGYVNFSGNSGVLSSNTLLTSSTNNIGDVQLVSSSSAIVENDNSVSQNTVQTGLVSNGDTVQTSSLTGNSQEGVTATSQNSNEYFSELKMERNDMFSKTIETYQKIVDSSTISSEQKAIAIQEIEKINNLQNSIKVAEELIKLKGFDDVVIYSSNEKVSVIVRIAALSDTQVAQIQNIVSKELGAKISDITISNK